MTDLITISSVVAFWKEAGPDKWYAKEEAFDREFRDAFHDLHWAAARRELDGWMETAEGALGLMILLDQYPRNSYRGTAHQFATDPLARHFAIQALDDRQDHAVENDLRRFFYLPLQHAEDMALQDRQVKLFQSMVRPDDDRWAEHHHGIIARFRRFPHRNRVLGRETTPDEQVFLDEDGFGV